MNEKFGKLPIYITENGYADTDPTLEDVNRIQYYKDHLEQVNKTIFNGLLSLNSVNNIEKTKDYMYIFLGGFISIITEFTL